MEIQLYVNEAEAEGIANKRDVLRFFSYVHEDIISGCWNWTGARKKPPSLPYGFFVWEGKSRLAHRVSYEWWVDDLIHGLDIDHKCDNPMCVNPDHLQQVTRHKNLMRSKGITAENSKKEKCPKGHSYSGVNSQGRRICKICQREANTKARRAKGIKSRSKSIHGTAWRYNNYGCRCELCCQAKRDSRKS